MSKRRSVLVLVLSVLALCVSRELQHGSLLATLTSASSGQYNSNDSGRTVYRDFSNQPQGHNTDTDLAGRHLRSVNDVAAGNAGGTLYERNPPATSPLQEDSSQRNAMLHKLVDGNSDGFVMSGPVTAITEENTSTDRTLAASLTDHDADVDSANGLSWQEDVQENPPEDESPSILTSMLKDAFLSHNPGMPFSGSLDDVDSSFNGWQPRLNLPKWFQGNPNKRSQEEVPVLSGIDESAAGDSVKEVDRRSWRCSFPDMLMGDEELPWTCRQHFVWRYLGEHVYPSRLYESVCGGRTCWYGHFNCTAIKYTLHVLQACRGCQDQRVPALLRSRWQWTNLNVTVGCQCIR